MLKKLIVLIDVVGERFESVTRCNTIVEIRVIALVTPNRYASTLSICLQYLKCHLRLVQIDWRQLLTLVFVFTWNK